MEILNSIGIALTTENELLTNIITAPTVFIEAFLICYLFTSILKIKYTKKQRNIYVVLFSFISLITENLIDSPFNVFVNYIVLFIVIKSVFKISSLKTILSIIIPSVTFALAGTLVLKPILVLFNLSVEEVTFIPIYRLCYLTILYIVIFILIELLNFKNFTLTFNEEFDFDNKKVILINIIFGFFTLCVQLIITVFYTDILPPYIIFLSFISLLAYFSISFYSLTKTMKLQVTTKTLEITENYNNTLSILYDNVKAFKHDFDNMIFIIGGFIDTNDIEGLKKYYKSLEKDCQRVNNIALLNPNLINNSGIYNLLTAKYQKATLAQVEIQLDFFFDLDKLHMPIYDFSRILGILIDNAIEAASSTDEKLVKISFRDSNLSHVQIIEIENSYSNKNIDKNKIFEKGFTEKENHSGIGLWEVKQIIKRNNNITLTTEPNEIYFKQHLEINY